ncbi:MAG: GNAT family N-acetyltransferase [Terriglobales bacterium]
MPPVQSAWGETSERSRRVRDRTYGAECPELRFGNARRQHRVIWGARRASKLGLEVRLAGSSTDLRQWYDLYLETMRKVAVPPRPYRLFAELWQECARGDHVKLFLAEQQEGARCRIIAGSMLLVFGQTAFWAFTGCAEENLQLHPHDLLQLAAIRYAYNNGFRWYDLGEVPGGHASLAQFKSKWGTSPKILYRYYFPAQAAAREDYSGLVPGVRILWRALPKKATAILGDLVYQFL